MNSTIKAIIFDYGGVITHPQDSIIINEMITLLELNNNDFLKSYRLFRPDYDSNLITASQYWSKILAHNKIPASSSLINQLINLDVYSWQQINFKTIELIKHLRNTDIKLAIISNMIVEGYQYMQKNFKWFDLFDHLVWSFSLKTSKPQNEIYQKCLDDLNLQPKECLFIDDSKENVISADKLGFNTYHFIEIEGLKSKLKYF